MYKIASLGLIAVLAVMMVPASFETNSNGEIATFYGYSVLALKDSSGAILFENGVHNEVLSLGVDFIMDSTFSDTVAGFADADQIDAICINAGGGSLMTALFSTTNETAILSDWNDNDGTAADTHCEGVTFTTVASGSDGIATASSTAATFSSADGNLVDGDTVIGIALCEITTAGGQQDCEDPLFAMVDTSDVTVNSGETLDISYTMTLD